MLPQINNSRSNGGLGAFYAANGVRGSSPTRGGNPQFYRGLDGSNPGVGYHQAPQFGQQQMQRQGDYFPAMYPGLPHAQQQYVTSQPSNMQTRPQMGANPMIGAMMNMQSQLMHKRQANMMLKQRSMMHQQQQQHQHQHQHQHQQQQQQQQQAIQGARMGAKPLNPRRGAGPQIGMPIAPQAHSEASNDPIAPLARPPGTEDSGSSNNFPPPGSGSSRLRQQQDGSADPQKEAFDIGQKMAQMDQMIKEAKEEREKRAEAERQAIEEQQRKQEEAVKEQQEKKEKNNDDNLDLEDLSLLDKLEHEIRNKIDENEMTLHELEMTDEELKLAAELAGKEAMKEKFKDRLADIGKKGKSRGKVPLQPLWRHRLDGLESVPKDRILKGKSLFRSCAWGIVIMYVRPRINIRRRKETFSEKNAVEFKRTLEAFSEASCSWWGNLLKIPIMSVQEDLTLSLRPCKRGTFDVVRIDKKNLLSLKVRTLGITKTLHESRMPPDYITQFLVEMLSDDNYFYKGFFYPEEEKKIELDDFGGTRGMVREPAEARDVDVEIPCKRGQVILGEKSLKRRKVDASRARMLLQNFVFTRVIINHCLCTPWNFRVGRKPSKVNKDKVIDNLRVISTIMYLALRYINDHFPECRPNLAKKYWTKLSKEEKEKAIAEGRYNDGGDGGKDDKDNKGSKGDDGTPSGDNEEKGEKPISGNDGKHNDGSDSDDDSSVSSTSSTDSNNGGAAGPYKEGTVMHYLFGRRLTAKEKATKRGPEDLLREDLMFVSRPPYCQLQQTIDNLIDEDEFENVRKEIDEWLPDAAKAIEEYTDKLLVHVLESREGVLHDEVHELVEGHENAPEGDLTEAKATARKEAKLTARRAELEQEEVKKKARAEAVLGGRGSTEEKTADDDNVVIINSTAQNTARNAGKLPPAGVKLDLATAGISSSTLQQETVSDTTRGTGRVASRRPSTGMKVAMKPPTPEEQQRMMN